MKENDVSRTPTGFVQDGQYPAHVFGASALTSKNLHLSPSLCAHLMHFLLVCLPTSAAQ